MRKIMVLFGIFMCFSTVISQTDFVIKQALINTKTKQPEIVRTMLSTQKGFAVTADGSYWALVKWIDGSYTTGAPFQVNDSSRHLLLMQSTDKGKTWIKVTEARTTGDHYGSMVVDPDGYTLHVVWYAWNGQYDSRRKKGYSSIFYSTFDTRTKKWTGTKDIELVKGQDAYYRTYGSPDIAITEKGVIGVTFSCARGVPQGWVGKTWSWASGLLWYKNGKWSKPHQINVDYSGRLVDIHAYGDDFYMCYRVNTGGYGIVYRRFDTIKEQFGPEGEIPVKPDPNNKNKNVSNLYANNAAVLGIFPNGDIIVLYATGTSHYGGGKLWYVYAKAGTHKFGTPFQIDDDSKMGWGNNTYYFYSLVRNGNAMAVVYSKKVENNKNLYMRVLTPNGPIPPYNQKPITLKQGIANDQFQLICGFRQTFTQIGMHFTYSDYSAKGPLTGGTAMLFGNPSGFAFIKGKGCSGSLSKTPRLFTQTIPAINSIFPIDFYNHPANTAGVFFIGTNDKKLFGTIPLPFDLSSFGLRGCYLYQDIRMTFTYSVNTQGQGKVQLPIPNVPSMAGIPFFVQGALIAVGANPMNLLFTNSMVIVF